jgi:bifunctional non-homologous end joining protein LigD
MAPEGATTTTVRRCGTVGAGLAGAAARGDDGAMATTQPRATRLIRPMLATLGPLPPPPGEDGDWAYELKWDGVRAVAYLGAGPYRLLSRTDQDMTGRYPELAALADTYRDRELVLDGEIVALVDGRPSFSRLQQRMQVRLPEPDLVAAVPVVYLVFDVLHQDGRSLLTRPYRERRELLDELDPHGPHWQTPPAWFGGGQDVLAASRHRGLEGVIAKRATSAYRPGTRGRDWIKTKNIRMQEVVIGGWTEGQGRRTGTIGALLLGIPDPPGNARLRRGGGLRYVGHVGTGFTDATLHELHRRLDAAGQDSSPFTAGDGVPRPHARGAHWVTPTIVGEVAYAEWTPDDLLRHPSWRGYRPDKTPADVHRD